MRMSLVTTTKGRLALFSLIIILLFALGACAGADTDSGNEAGGGLEGTPLGVETAEGLPEGEATTGPIAETAVMTGTMPVEETAMATEAATEAPAETATSEATATSAATATMAATAVSTATVEITGTTDVMGDVTLIRASDLIGLNVTNDAGEAVGEISEVLFDLQGALQYVVFDASAFIGDDAERIVAAEWSMFQTADETQSLAGEEAGVGTTPTVESTPSAETTPEVATTPSVTEDEMLTGERQPLLFRGAATDLESAAEIDSTLLDGEGVLVDAAELNLAGATGQLLRLSRFAASGLLDFNLVNEAGDDLGEIEDMIVDLSQGQVLYAIADVGGFLGIGEQSVPIPWDQIQFDEEGQNFVVDADEDTLTNAPALEADFDENIDSLGIDWDADIRTFWETR